MSDKMQKGTDIADKKKVKKASKKDKDKTSKDNTNKEHYYLPIKTNKKIEKRNFDIRQMKVQSGRDHVDIIIGNLISCSLDNLSGQNKTIIKPSHDRLCIENDWGDVGLALNLFKKMEAKGCFKKFSYDGERYHFHEPNVVKIKKYKKERSKPIEDKKGYVRLDLKEDDLDWQDITIIFRNKHDVKILVKKEHQEVYSYEELGFAKTGTKDKEPDNQWQLLCLLAINKKVELPLPDASSQGEVRKKVISDMEKMKKRKSKLKKQLEELFNIKEDPFKIEYEKSNDPTNPKKIIRKRFYKAKFKLMPEKIFRDDVENLKTKKTEYLPEV